ncbi:Isthmin [Formica fusca]|uniref:isthmin-2-like isoform X2 n=1 Tax=Formica exsecta TaxID=72781 RepID=UPI0011446DD5|nr:isthmin-2-like isoform X2 [Formica exsecta]
MVVRSKCLERRMSKKRNAVVLRNELHIDKMRALRIICLAAIFPSILAIPFNDKNYQIRNSKTTLDVEHKANEMKIQKRLLDSPLQRLFISPEDKDEKFHLIQTRYRRSDHIKSNAESSTLTKEKNEETTLISESESPEEINLSGENFADMDILFRSRTSRSENADIYDTNTESLDEEEYEGLNTLLAKLFEALQNDSAKDNHDILKGSNSIGNTSNDEDRCQKWLDNREKIEQAFPGSIDELPACPCRYPNDIFYDDLIWDRNRQKKFRWRDASNDPQRLVYKQGAFYCVRSLPAQGSESIGAQHCCYDEERRLLTRGSGAGTPYIVSPDMSFVLHDKIDLLPWRLCKGDFTRYNKVRVPNNDDDCKVNPDDEEYEYQEENAKNY